MASEIERKWLIKEVNLEFLKHNSSYIHSIRQGYLNRNPFRTVRVRTTSNVRSDGLIEVGSAGSSLTIKGISKGAKREEISVFMYEPTEVESLFRMCEAEILKTRYTITIDVTTGLSYYGTVNVGGGSIRNLEVDIFHGELEGLILAEIEFFGDEDIYLKSELKFPESVVIEREVTLDHNYFNSVLVERCIVNDHVE